MQMTSLQHTLIQVLNSVTIMYFLYKTFQIIHSRYAHLNRRLKYQIAVTTDQKPNSVPKVIKAIR